MSNGATLYVDGSLPANCSAATYNLTTRACNGADGSGFSDFASAIAAAQPGDSIEIRGGTYATPLIINKSGTPSSRLRIAGYAAETVTIDLEGTPFGIGVSIDHQSFIDLSRLIVTRASFYGLKGTNVTDLTISDSEFSYSLHSGAVFEGGARIAVTRSRIHHNHTVGTTGFHEAITFQGIDEFSITDSEVYDNNKEGIDAKYGSHNGVIARNHVYRNTGPNIYLDAVSDVRVFNNLCHDTGWNTKSCIGLAIESASNPDQFALAHVAIVNNVIYGSGAGISFWAETDDPWAVFDNIRVEYNTIVDNSVNNWGAIFINGFINVAAITVRNNILIANGGWAIRDDLGVAQAFTVTHNLFQSGEHSSSFGTNALFTSAPQFVNRGDGDYHLRMDSPARFAGQGVPDITTDITGAARPVEATDVGAYQYAASVAGSNVPVPTIVSPAVGALYKVGDLVTISGAAVDPDTGSTLAGSALSWRVFLDLCPASEIGDCDEQLLQEFDGASGTVTVPDHRYPAFLRFELKATKSTAVVNALSASVSQTIFPETATMTFDVAPTGLHLTIDGMTAAAPASRLAIVNSHLPVSAPGPQIFAGDAYVFASWSDGGAQSHLATAAATPFTLVAIYAPMPAATCTLKVSPATAGPGQVITIAWTATNAATVSLDNGAGVVSPAAAGTMATVARATTTYRALATGLGGPGSCTAKATVNTSAPSVWNSWDVLMQPGSPQARVAAGASGVTANVEFYESADEGGVNQGAILSAFSPGTHPAAFNSVSQYWGLGAGDVYPYAGKSVVVRGAGVGESATRPPLGVRDLQLFPPDSLHTVVAAFRVPMPGTYAISNLGVRRVHNEGSAVRYQVFNAEQVRIATMTTGANQAWVNSPATYTLAGLTTGSYLYFAVDSGGDVSYDAAEVSWTVTRTAP